MVLRVQSSITNKDIANKAYIVTAIYYYANEDGTVRLRYLTNANAKAQGGLPTAFNDEDVTIEDGYIPSHWIVAQQHDKYGRCKTIITYPEWARDPDYFDKLDNNEEDNMAAINKYGEELKELALHYTGTNINGLSLEPFSQ